MKRISTQIDIAASPATVWSILIDNARYPEWNPYYVKVEGAFRVGNQLRVEICKPNGERVETDPYVMQVVPMRLLTWGGGIEGIFYREHRFVLESSHAGNTRLTHREDFSGTAVSFASLGYVEEGYNLVNAALKHRAEDWQNGHEKALASFASAVSVH